MISFFRSQGPLLRSFETTNEWRAATMNVEQVRVADWADDSFRPIAFLRGTVSELGERLALNPERALDDLDYFDTLLLTYGGHTVGFVEYVRAPKKGAEVLMPFSVALGLGRRGVLDEVLRPLGILEQDVLAWDDRIE